MAYTSTTRAVLRTRLQERYEAQPFWSTTEANDALNEALRQYNLYTGFWRGPTSVVTVALQPFLSVPSSLTYRTRVYVSGRVLTRKSLIELYRGRRNWRSETTATGGTVPTTPREWAPVGLRQIVIWPMDTAGGTTLTIDGVVVTPVLTADGDFVDLGEEELHAILDEALWVLGGFKRPSEKAHFQVRHQAFLKACLLKNDRLRASAYFREALGLDRQQDLFPTRRMRQDQIDAGRED